jgi:hypothetical protein
MVVPFNPTLTDSAGCPSAVFMVPDIVPVWAIAILIWKISTIKLSVNFMIILLCVNNWFEIGANLFFRMSLNNPYNLGFKPEIVPIT